MEQFLLIIEQVDGVICFICKEIFGGILLDEIELLFGLIDKFERNII